MHSVDVCGDVSILSSPDAEGVSTHQSDSSLPVGPIGGSLQPLSRILLTTVVMFQYSIHQMQKEALLFQYLIHQILFQYSIHQMMQKESLLINLAPRFQPTS